MLRSEVQRRQAHQIQKGGGDVHDGVRIAEQRAVREEHGVLVSVHAVESCALQDGRGTEPPLQIVAILGNGQQVRCFCEGPARVELFSPDHLPDDGLTCLRVLQLLQRSGDSATHLVVVAPGLDNAPGLAALQVHVDAAGDQRIREGVVRVDIREELRASVSHSQEAALDEVAVEEHLLADGAEAVIREEQQRHLLGQLVAKPADRPIDLTVEVEEAIPVGPGPLLHLLPQEMLQAVRLHDMALKVVPGLIP